MSPSTSYHTLQRTALYIGVPALIVSCAMSGAFGWQMSAKHAIGLMLITVFAAIIFPFKSFVHRMGFKGAARTLGVIGAFFGVVEFYSHVGYTTGMRELSAVEATAQNANYKNEQDGLASEKANLDMWRTRLKKLEEEQAWIATVTADSLRAQVAVAQKEIDLEAARGGCKSKCALRMKDKADLEAKIALTEEKSDLSKKIEATQKIIDAKQTVAKDTKVGFSAAKAQNDFVGKLWLLASGTEADKALNPDAVTTTVTGTVIGVMIALATTLLPTTAFYMAFFGARPPRVPEEDEEEPVVARERPIAPAPRVEPMTSLARLLRDYDNGRGYAQPRLAGAV